FLEFVSALLLGKSFCCCEFFAAERKFLRACSWRFLAAVDPCSKQISSLDGLWTHPLGSSTARSRD
ncbi:hypothetical protein U1Q18_039268, partial [Sarracenia purpurea var. burkii]